MKTWKRLLIWKLCMSLLLLPGTSLELRAQTTTSQAAQWNMNRALSGVTQQALQSRGYVASDPRTYSTLSSMSTTAGTIAGGAAATAAAVALAGVTAPAWGSILLVAGVSSLVGVLVQLGVTRLVNWLFRPDQKIDQTAPPGQFASCVTGSLLYWDAVAGGQTIYACDGMDLAP